MASSLSGKEQLFWSRRHKRGTKRMRAPRGFYFIHTRTLQNRPVKSSHDIEQTRFLNNNEKIRGDGNKEINRKKRKKKIFPVSL
jgi:hypothetical protein